MTIVIPSAIVNRPLRELIYTCKFLQRRGSVLESLDSIVVRDLGDDSGSDDDLTIEGKIFNNVSLCVGPVANPVCLNPILLVLLIIQSAACKILMLNVWLKVALIH